MIATAVTAYWQSRNPDVNRVEQLELLSTSLHEIERSENTTQPQKRLSLSARTAVRWLHQMGYDWKEVKKGIYKDGHERQDVVQYRQETFLKRMDVLRPRMPYPLRSNEGKVIGIGLPTMPPGERLCIPVTHDECTCNANDGPHHQWIKGDENPLRSKARGMGLHISEFITPWGRLSVGKDVMSDEQLLQLGLNQREATEIMQCGGDIWWNQEDIVQQTLHAITIFEAAHPGCQALFLFDNATSHSAFAEDALRASKMNKGWGGKQPHPRDGYYQNKEGDIQVQKMSYEERDSNIPRKKWGKAKGIQVVLEERGLWPKDGLYLDCTSRKPPVMHEGNGCCARHLLSQQPDFLAQKGRVQEVVEAKGHMVLFYPKFHCELNWIEYFWARVKLYTRSHCRYDIKSLRENVPAALVWASDLIPKWWGKAWRIMDAYRDGISYGTEEFKLRAYKSHRTVTISAVNSV